MHSTAISLAQEGTTFLSAGAELLAAEKDEVAGLIERCTVFAKVTPQQKMAIVAALQARCRAPFLFPAHHTEHMKRGWNALYFKKGGRRNDRLALFCSLLQARDHIVGFLGDGTNDALALRKADVGISVDSGAFSLP